MLFPPSQAYPVCEQEHASPRVRIHSPRNSWRLQAAFARGEPGGDREEGGHGGGVFEAPVSRGIHGDAERVQAETGEGGFHSGGSLGFLGSFSSVCVDLCGGWGE